ncbi:MAG: hypothetical protein LIV24_03465 [Eubacterium sp.]|nr:hypothetical protein [Eubacterium sp.]
MDMSRGSKFKDGVRIAAAAYLIYLGMQVISEALKDSTEKKQILFIIFGAVFIAVGVVIGIWSLKSLVGTVKAENTADPSDDGEQDGTDEGADYAGGSAESPASAITQQDDGTQGQADSVPVRDAEPSEADGTAGADDVDTEKKEHKPSLFDKAGGNISGK